MTTITVHNFILYFISVAIVLSALLRLLEAYFSWQLHKAKQKPKRHSVIRSWRGVHQTRCGLLMSQLPPSATIGKITCNECLRLLAVECSLLTVDWKESERGVSDK